MTIRSDIPKSAGWIRYETKFITLPVLDDDGVAVDVSAIDLVWKLSREEGSNQVYLTKTSDIGGGIQVAGADDNEVTITIQDTEYDTIPDGLYYHELWNATSSLRLTHGDAYLGRSSGPSILA